jgi:alpha-galactosidase
MSRLRHSLIGTAFTGVLIAASTAPAPALDNGLALTPPMGWNSWNQVRCYGLNEAVVRDAADALVATGMRDAGYKYVVVDDCWQAHQRAADGSLQADPERFPSGMKALADYVHERGLKFGIYSVPGSRTCAMTWDDYPGENLGSLGHEAQDARMFASWGVDYLKYDWCQADKWDGLERVPAFTKMRDELAATGRPITYSISEYGETEPWKWAEPVANSWRTTQDIQPTYASMLSIFHQNVGLDQYAGPGGWNDPDMLEVGRGMSFTEDRAEFSLWAIMAAPLIAGTDLRSASPATMSLYTNADVIKVDQDKLGKQGHLVSSAGALNVLAKPLSDGDVAVVLFNENADAATVSTTASAVGAAASSTYKLTNLWSKAVTSTDGKIEASVPGHGVVMYRVASGTGTSVGTTGELVGASSDRCLDVDGGQTAPGTKVQIWDCLNGGNQRWTPTAAGELRAYNGTQCLDVDGGATAPETKVQLWSCNGGAHQKWRLNPDGTITGVQSGLCLDVAHGDVPDGNVNGSQVQIFTCNGGANQQWVRRL